MVVVLSGKITVILLRFMMLLLLNRVTSIILLLQELSMSSFGILRLRNAKKVYMGKEVLCPLLQYVMLMNRVISSQVLLRVMYMYGKEESASIILVFTKEDLYLL